MSVCFLYIYCGFNVSSFLGGSTSRKGTLFCEAVILTFMLWMELANSSSFSCPSVHDRMMSSTYLLNMQGMWVPLSSVSSPFTNVRACIVSAKFASNGCAFCLEIVLVLELEGVNNCCPGISLYVFYVLQAEIGNFDNHTYEQCICTLSMAIDIDFLLSGVVHFTRVGYWWKWECLP